MVYQKKAFKHFWKPYTLYCVNLGKYLERGLPNLPSFLLLNASLFSTSSIFHRLKRATKYAVEMVRMEGSCVVFPVASVSCLSRILLP